MLRNSKTISVNSYLLVTVYELTVGDVLFLLWLMDEFEYPKQLEEFALKHFETLHARSAAVVVFSLTTNYKKLYDKEKKKITDLFFEINQAFFKSGEEVDGPLGERLFDGDSITGKAFYHNLSSTIEALTRQGHANILTYPFSFFLTVLENFNEAHKNG
jgi:hypothetical protein